MLGVDDQLSVGWKGDVVFDVWVGVVFLQDEIVVFVVGQVEEVVDDLVCVVGVQMVVVVLVKVVEVVVVRGWLQFDDVVVVDVGVGFLCVVCQVWGFCDL